MNFFEIAIIAVGLAMDAFAVSICKGLSIKKLTLKASIIIALYFGVFQALMPVLGYFLGSSFSSFVQQIDHWVAFILLLIIGSKMIKDSTCKDDENLNANIDFSTMIVLAIATSIDALAIGVTFAFFKVNLLVASLTIGIITFLISALGVVVGKRFGNKFQSKAELLGGIILILIGLKILLEHLGLLP